jgi:hypothetical protein
VAGGDLADPAFAEAADRQRGAVGGDVGAGGGEQPGQPLRVRAAGAQPWLAVPGDELGQQQVGEQPAAAEDEQVVGGELDLADQVAGDDDGAPLRITVDRDELRVTVDARCPRSPGSSGVPAAACGACTSAPPSSAAPRIPGRSTTGGGSPCGFR